MTRTILRVGLIIFYIKKYLGIANDFFQVEKIF
jgi:hypothetical protein